MTAVSLQPGATTESSSSITQSSIKMGGSYSGMPLETSLTETTSVIAVA